jgi:flagellar protein FlgJ
MDVNGLGAAYLDDYRLGGSILNQGKNGLSGASPFEDALKKAAAGMADGADPNAALPHAQSPVSGSRSLAAKIDKTDKLYEQCMELEIFLVKTLVSSMRSTVQKSSLVDEGFAGKMYEDMLYDEYARNFAKNANFGLADMAYLELTGQRGKLYTHEAVPKLQFLGQLP